MSSSLKESDAEHRGNVVCAAVTVRGAVQGVGFRPFVYRLAKSLGLSGFVRNQGGLVYLEVTGNPQKVEELILRIRSNPPPLARVDAVEVSYGPGSPLPTGEPGTSYLPRAGFEQPVRDSFVVLDSVEGENSLCSEAFTGPGIPPDSSVCEKCRTELTHPGDRRYLYPFINCTECGPRFTIVESAPYDRFRTTMKTFRMCPACREEYSNPLDRRFHAEPNACPECGPRASFEFSQLSGVSNSEGDARGSGQDWLQQAQRLLSSGGVLAIKGIGGFHLACDATDSAAVALLRARKRRTAKPFAIMVKDIDTVRRWFYVSPSEEEILVSRAAPIVILRARKDCPVARNVAPGLNHIGVMLPYSPLHLMLFLPPQGSRSGYATGRGPDLDTAVPEALVMTSGNRSGEPLVYQNEEARSSLGALVDGFVMHNREIARPCDDSVVRVIDEKVLFYRRSRGWVPETLDVSGACGPARDATPLIFAAGADGKNVFGFLSRGKALLSQHVGDLYSQEGICRYEFLVRDLRTLYGFEPDLLAIDGHPGYEVSRSARKLFPGRPAVEVQHHHAHMASVMAEHGLKDRCVGVILDGTGYGTDGQVWGGEILAADYRSFDRLYHLAYVPMPGGEKAVAEPWRMAVSYLKLAYGDDAREIAFRLFPQLVEKIERLWPAVDSGVWPLTSSAGRLFDAVAAVTGISTTNTYDGESASLLGESADEAALSRRPPSTFRLKPASVNLSLKAIDTSSLIRSIVDQALQGCPKGDLALFFHEALAELLGSYASYAARCTGTKDVVLSGGVFQNPLFVQLMTSFLQRDGLRPHVAAKVPPNDGGIALGQAVIALNTALG